MKEFLSVVIASTVIGLVHEPKEGYGQSLPSSVNLPASSRNMKDCSFKEFSNGRAWKCERFEKLDDVTWGPSYANPTLWPWYGTGYGARVDDDTFMGRERQPASSMPYFHHNKWGTVMLEAKTQSYGDYDRAVAAAMGACWRHALDAVPHPPRAGKVILEFKLDQNGRVSEIQETLNQVGTILGLACYRAILDPAPYAKWPAEMCSSVVLEHRRMQITFTYH